MVDIGDQVRCHDDHDLHLLIMIIMKMMASDEADGCCTGRGCLVSMPLFASSMCYCMLAHCVPCDFELGRGHKCGWGRAGAGLGPEGGAGTRIVAGAGWGLGSGL